jgi:hypothetical protein
MNIYAGNYFLLPELSCGSDSLTPYKINCYRVSVMTNKLAAQSLPY